MRKIIFRGKCEDTKEWLYGFYTQFQHPNHLEMKYCICTDKSQYTKVMGVFPETVGQFTGLTDKNGIEIYEGDIVTGTTFKYEVVFRDGSYLLEYIDKIIVKSISIKKQPSIFLEIIGNIHDNPSLLTNKE